MSEESQDGSALAKKIIEESAHQISAALSYTKDLSESQLRSAIRAVARLVAHDLRYYGFSETQIVDILLGISSSIMDVLQDKIKDKPAEES